MESTNIDIKRVTTAHGLVLVEMNELPNALKGHKLLFADADGRLELSLYESNSHEITLRFTPDSSDMPALLQLGKATSFTVIGTAGSQTDSVTVSYPERTRKELSDAVHKAYEAAQKSVNESVDLIQVLYG